MGIKKCVEEANSKTVSVKAQKLFWDTLHDCIQMFLYVD